MLIWLTSRLQYCYAGQINLGAAVLCALNCRPWNVRCHVIEICCLWWWVKCCVELQAMCWTAGPDLLSGGEWDCVLKCRPWSVISGGEWNVVCWIAGRVLNCRPWPVIWWWVRLCVELQAVKYALSCDRDLSSPISGGEWNVLNCRPWSVIRAVEWDCVLNCRPWSMHCHMIEIWCLLSMVRSETVCWTAGQELCTACDRALPSPISGGDWNVV